MRAVEFTHTYKKQYKRLKRAGWNMDLLDHSVEVLLTEDVAELERLWDHQLTGKKKAFREIHVGQRASDWVIEYEITEAGTVVLLLQTGSHNKVLGL
ncbi:type II toxin-antitoxin system YafQ family toxin [Lacticaseibacillus porcinae]|uniref:type II toxin-antitoxin system RelE/ParE family toxin n=1 Tax=Lacticaseibacillus porcinae TaxID=1123687 RepID=UPI000F7B1773|nr:type II toxin-antitoxin system mRNA interferase toxin, RelE/StbE family [Lacticaseibacillus porcinae]